MKSLYNEKYRHFVELLVNARKAAGVTQEILAKKLGRPQSFVSKVENGDRRIDVVEFLMICRLIGADPNALIRKVDNFRKRD